MLYSFGVQFSRLIALIQPSRLLGSVGKRNNFILLFTVSTSTIHSTTSGRHFDLQNGGDYCSREIRCIIIDHAHKRQPVYMHYPFVRHILQLWRADGRHRLSKPPVSHKPPVSQHTVAEPTHYIRWDLQHSPS